MTEFVNINGEPLSMARLYAHPKPVKAKNEAPAEWHRGWVVEGLKPGSIAAAEARRHADIAEWSALTDEARSQKVRDGHREPKPWNAEAYIASAKRDRLRARPFECESAADDMKALAERSGWECVRVVELAKRKQS